MSLQLLETAAVLPLAHLELQPLHGPRQHVLGFARLPHGAGWLHIYGIACLAGIGFTMSLFIGSLSFADPAQMNAVRLGVLSGSLVSAILGYGVLMLAARREAAPAPA